MNTFDTFEIKPELLRAIKELGYEEPTEIQDNAIPDLLEGRDVLGQAQTGTGKTAAFALPILNKLDPNARHVQALVLTPTRELAIQVSKAISQYGKHLNIRVLPVYGGQSYTPQLKGLQSGSQVVVGTPGRLLDLVQKKNALDLSQVSFLVLDEADEMLAMGFLDEVEEVIKQTPIDRQTAFFSATLPQSIRKMAGQYLRDPKQIIIQHKTVTVDQTEQSYYLVRDSDKVAALIRIFETETVQSALLFTRTKARASEFSDALLAKGFSVEALHGDLKQSEREKVMDRFRKDLISVLVATDVAARGLDIEGVSHVINVDVPLDAESYVHRIGRTGRAGKSGMAITLATPGEKRLLTNIERYIKQPILKAELPSVADIQARRDEQFIDRIVANMAMEESVDEQSLVQQIAEFGYTPAEIAAAAIHLAREAEEARSLEKIKSPKDFNSTSNKDRSSRQKTARNKNTQRKRPSGRSSNETGMVRLSIDLGKADQIKPSNIVGAIANTTGIPGRAIGAIDIQHSMTFLDVSETHVEAVMRKMKKWKINDKPVNIQYT